MFYFIFIQHPLYLMSEISSKMFFFLNWLHFEISMGMFKVLCQNATNVGSNTPHISDNGQIPQSFHLQSIHIQYQI